MSDQHGNDYIDRQGFRANVGIVLMRDTGELFLGGRVGARGWQFPQGGVNRGEHVEEALFRELTEEIGLRREHVEVLGSTRGWLRYRLPRQYVRDRCIGQKQRWFLLRLTAEESQFRFDSTDQPEFDRWRWVDYWTPVREVVYFKRARICPGAARAREADFSERLAAVSGMVAGDRHAFAKSGGPTGTCVRIALSRPAMLRSALALFQGFTTASTTMPISSSEGISLNTLYHFPV